MARYFVTHQSLSYDCGYVTVNMRTNSTQHLWLLYATTGPSIEGVPDAQQDANKPHHLNFTLYIDGVIEQEEAGDTILHTFKFALPASQPVVYFYTINMGTAGLKATRSPIFAYEFDPIQQWQETWLPGLDSINHFTFSYDTAIQTPVTGMNIFRAPSVALGLIGVLPCIAQLGNSFSAIMPTFDSCGTLITITVPKSDADTGYGSPYVWLTLHNPSGPEWPTNIVFKTGGANTLPADTPPPINVFPITVPDGQHSFSLNEILRVRHLAYPDSTPPGVVEATFIEVAGGSHSPQLGYYHEYDFGPITISHVDETPRDISKFWRNRRPVPKLR